MNNYSSVRVGVAGATGYAGLELLRRLARHPHADLRHAMASSASESKRLPADLDYANMPGLSREIVEKLSRVRPQSIAQASRIPGITPASISILLFHLEMRQTPRQPENVM